MSSLVLLDREAQVVKIRQGTQQLHSKLSDIRNQQPATQLILPPNQHPASTLYYQYLYQ